MDLTGQKFGKLTVVARDGIAYAGTGRSRTLWRCSCECGGQRVTTSPTLKWGRATSCGCTRRKHGHSWDVDGKRSPTYRSWQNMIARCSQPSNPAYEHYRTRGITVCDRWRDFAMFLADMGDRPPRTSIDRIDNDRNYEPGNCRWASKRTQGNNRITNTKYEYRGVRYTLADLSRHTGVHKDILRARLVRQSGWTVEGAVLTPVVARQNRRKMFRA